MERSTITAKGMFENHGTHKYMHKYVVYTLNLHNDAGGNGYGGLTESNSTAWIEGGGSIHGAVAYLAAYLKIQDNS